jgi:hypothetical protein
MSEPIDFQVEGGAEAMREEVREPARAALSLEAYLDSLTDWTERMFPEARPRDNSTGFDRPFDLFEDR